MNTIIYTQNTNNYNKEMKNTLLYAYYECYLQQHNFYKKHKDKNFYAVTTLGVIIWILFWFPLTILIGKIINIKKESIYIVIIAYTYFEVYYLSRKIGDGDLTDRINNSYEERQIVKKSRINIWIFVVLCVLLWSVALMYDE